MAKQEWHFQLDYCPVIEEMFTEPRFPKMTRSTTMKTSVVMTPSNSFLNMPNKTTCDCKGTIHLDSSGRDIDIEFYKRKEPAKGCDCYVKGQGKFRDDERKELIRYFAPNCDM